MNKKPVFSLLHLWLLIPAIPFYAQVLLNARNIPKEDDYDAILGWLIRFKEATSWDKIALLFAQHNEHRILHSRIVYLLYDFICGGINFRNLIIIGDLQLLVVGIIVCYFCLKYVGKYREVIAAVWMIVLFDGNTYENADWAMAAVQNYGIVMLFMLSLFFYDRRTWWPGPIFQAIMIFSSGNGIIGSIVIAAFAFRKSWPAFLVAANITLAFGAAYFIDYRSSPAPIDPTKSVIFFIEQAGAHLSFANAFICGLITGGGILYFFPWRGKSSPFVCIAGFILASMATIALFRASASNAQFQTSRYLIYPEILTATAITFLAVKWENKKHLRWILAGVLIILLRIYTLNYTYGKAGFERTAARLDSYHFWYPDSKRAESIAHQSDSLGIYSIEDQR